MIIYRAAVQPLRRATGGEIGSHFSTDVEHHTDYCAASCWRYTPSGSMLMCDHGIRVHPLDEDVDAAALAYWAPLVR